MVNFSSSLLLPFDVKHHEGKMPLRNSRGFLFAFLCGFETEETAQHIKAAAAAAAGAAPGPYF